MISIKSSNDDNDVLPTMFYTGPKHFRLCPESCDKDVLWYPVTSTHAHDGHGHLSNNSIWSGRIPRLDHLYNLYIYIYMNKITHLQHIIQPNR